MHDPKSSGIAKQLPVQLKGAMKPINISDPSTRPPLCNEIIKTISWPQPGPKTLHFRKQAAPKP